ncbi:CLAVATA3/ESR (CLE)-related protein 25 [Cicer arietinum]|uniref:CLAVATA3/ESR (CLE)-related protein 25 n=1 Tax=Cicer arietinum TaxID=3827 RepID=A0A1S2XK98_CICAR|nr:CLAVATA3/ESR (CLE)-related protein 25 [Cicer arietinum]
MDTSSSNSNYFLPRLLFRVIVVVGLVCFIVFGSLLLVSGEGGTGQTTTTTQWSNERVLNKHDEQIVGKDNHEELDFNYMSKRRVPNGPDPIHNRRAGNSGRPPGQS